MKLKHVLTMLLCAVLLVLGASCGKGETSGTSGSSSAAATVENAVPARSTAKRQKIEFWYHSADAASDAFFQKYFAKLNASQDKYEVVYTSFAFADFQSKFQMAVMTDTMPDMVSLGFSNAATFISQNSIIALDDYTDQITDFDSIDENLLVGMRKIGNGKLYGIPFAYNQEVAWYNTQRFAELGIGNPPMTQTEFLEYCKKYADPASSRYFYSLRGVRPYDSLVAWLWTYTDGLGYEGSWFDENGKCILRRSEFVDALNAYADIYKNKEVSGDSVNNNFSQIVAEFGSGVSAYIIHNSSSEPTHLKNLGAGNFAAARVLANDEGNYFASGIQPNIYCITNKGANADYTGALWLLSRLTDVEAESELCQVQGRVPVNMGVQQEQWFKEDPEMKLYMSYLSDPNYKQIDNPYWLAEFSTFITDTMTADFQAVLMGDKSAAACLKGWADLIDGYQAEYLSSLK